MQNEDRERFVQIMLGIADNFRDTITEQGMQFRFDMLKCYSIQDIERAARDIIRSRKFLKIPPVAEFVDAIEGSSDQKALNAWGELMKCLESGTEPKKSATKAIIKQMGGYSWLAKQSYDKLQWLEKRFIERYKSHEQEQQIALSAPGERMHRLAGGATKGM